MTASVVALESINLLGYTISHGVIKPDHDCLEPLINFPAPNAKNLQCPTYKNIKTSTLLKIYVRHIKRYSTIYIS